MCRSDAMTGQIHSIQSLGTVDGPGVRCVVFFQGCPLRCACCHNPDAWDKTGGREMEADQLVKQVSRYRSYFGEKGGVTLSGGEPLLQARFAAELFRKWKTAGIHTALDTSGCLWNEDVDDLLSVTDLVLLDHKYGNEEDCYRYTGGHLTQTQRFLTELDKRNIPTWLRRVIIPGKNDDETATRALYRLAATTPCVEKVELLPFRKLCAEKYTALGIPFPLADTPEPTEDTMVRLRKLGEKERKEGVVSERSCL